MSKKSEIKKHTVPSIVQRARKGEKLTMLTAYDATFARIIDEAGIDMILVGDSLGQVIQGRDNTLPVTLDEIIYHTSCVTRAVKHALVIADLPFMSYQASKTQALLACGRALKEGNCEAVKLEGGLEIAETVRAVTQTGIPVCAHIGLKPQTIHQMGGYKIHGKTIADEKKLIEEAKSLEDAGAFSIVLEGVTTEAAHSITQAVKIPTIGICAGGHCSGQVLVIYDLLGMNPDFHPTFLKTFCDGYSIVSDAIKKYIDEVKKGTFPSSRHVFHKTS